MRILITGGAGYVGRAITSRLCRSHDVAVVDNRTDACDRFSSDEARQLEFHSIDLRDADEVRTVHDHVRPDVVIHLAAVHYIPECEQHPDRAIEVNVAGTVNVLRSCGSGTRFVLASTAAVYEPDDAPHTEDSAIGPQDVYGLTKLQAEQYVQHWSRTSHLDACVLRLFNVIGPGETNPHLLPAILDQLEAGLRTLQLGNCATRRDYINVEDAATGFVASALRRGSPGSVEVLNLGTGRSYSARQIVDRLGDLMGSPLRIEVDPARVRATDRMHLTASTDKLARTLGWTPGTTLADSLSQLLSDAGIVGGTGG